MNITGQLFSLRWNNYLGHMVGSFESMLTEEDFVDVTLSCEGKKIKAHKMLLSACSSYFKDLFRDNPCQHPVIVFRNVRYDDLLALVNFIYQGEVNVEQEQLASFLSTAELLEVKGLTDTNSKKENDSDDIAQHVNVKSPMATNTNQMNSEVSLTPLSNKNFDCQVPISTKKRKIDPQSLNDINDVDGSSAVHIRRRTDKEIPPLSAIDKSVEIIPVISNVKMENTITDSSYYEQTNVSYSTNNETRESNNYADFFMHPHKSEPGNLDDGAHSVESDLSQMVSKSSVSRGDVSEDSIQGHWLSSLNTTNNERQPQTTATSSNSSNNASLNNNNNQKLRYICSICGATYKHLRNLRAHCHLHYGKTRCNLCNKVLCNISYFKKHLQQQHGLLMDGKT